jgi:molybdopterin converting factor small subunit
MQIHVHYWNQLREVRGLSDETIDMDDDASLFDLLQRIAKQPELGRLILEPDGAVFNWILIDRQGEMVRDTSIALSDGDVIRLSTHIAGG